MTNAGELDVVHDSTERIDSGRIDQAERLRSLMRSRTFIVGSVLFGVWIACAIFGDLLTPYDARAADPVNRLAPPSSDHLLGTDRLGRDVLSRTIVGARAVLTTAPLATLLAVTLGTIIGLVSGYYRGLVDEIGMRFLDALPAIPLVIMALLAVVALGPSPLTLILVIGLVFTPVVARTIRAAVVSERELEYVEAAIAGDERGVYIMFMEILPNVMSVLIVELTVRLGYAIFTIAALSFLGFGADPSIPDWGQDVAANYEFISAGVWAPVLFPSLAIVTLIVGVNLIADSTMQTYER